MFGFGNEFLSESKDHPGAIPRDKINPQKLKYDLFSEQLSGTAFTAPRHQNRRSWLYRIKPSVLHLPFIEVPSGFEYTGIDDPNQRRWKPFTLLETDLSVDFIDGIHTLAWSDQSQFCAIAIHIYAFNSNRKQRCLVNSDGDFLIVPQEGALDIMTEFGSLHVEPNEICVIQRGMKFTTSWVNLDNNLKFARGYILEVKGGHFELPYLGPIGANGLANPRDFETPQALVITSENFIICNKFRNKLFEATQEHSPYDVAGWFGNYTPYKYDLRKFVSVNSVSVDHPDPSIFTVLTCPMVGNPGTALADFVIFPPRWECAKDTFRPPYYHRNCMTEFMGLIEGSYQAKSSAFAPGGATLHQSMIPHGPDLGCYEKASKDDTNLPKRVADSTMTFMFETSLTLKVSQDPWFVKFEDKEYQKCWKGL